MQSLIARARHLLLALTMLALSAGLAFAALPPAAGPGLVNAAAQAGKTVPVAGGDETLGEDEETDEDADDDEDAGEDEDGGEDETAEGSEDEDTDEDAESDAEGAGREHCAIDPSALTEEELAALNHGSIACWAAHQAEWPEWFSNHGAFVRCWAHQGKAGAPSCTEAPATEDGTEVKPASADAANGGHGKGHGKAKGKLKHRV